LAPRLFQDFPPELLHWEGKLELDIAQTALDVNAALLIVHEPKEKRR
jgi:hypothetical protein